MEYALPSAWDQGSRGFWTKRKKSATSLLAVLSLIAGIAVAFKLFDREIPNNVVRDASKFDFQVHVQRSAANCTNTVPNDTGWCVASGADPIYQAGIDSYPGDTRTQAVRIRNVNVQPSKDASFVMYIDPLSIVVNGCTAPDPTSGVCATTPVIATTDPNYNKFVQFFTLTVDKEIVADVLLGEVNEQDYVPSRYSLACTGGLKEITKQSPCKLGTIRKAGSTGVDGGRTDQRRYNFKINEKDDGQDQSPFKGWTVTFATSFAARVPAEAEPSGFER